MSHPWEEDWTLGERLGKGGQGLTHLVTSKTEPSQTAAIKILKNNADSQARGRMHREVANLTVLVDAGGFVPRVLDHNTQHFEDAGVELFVVMEFIPGKTLKQLIQENSRLSIEKAGQITGRLCNTIEIAHTFPILHRDLKPENIIVRDLESADVVVLDYGLSFNAADPDLTQTEETFRNKFLDLPETNTPGGNRRDPRSDITAACGIFYFMLTGHVPGQLQGGDGRLPHMRAGFSVREALGDGSRTTQIELLLTRGFAPNVSNRFQTIEELRSRLRGVLRESDTTAVEDPIEVATRVSGLLRERDRTTQLQEFRQPAAKLITEIKKFANQYANKLVRFQLAILDVNSGHPLPDTIDRVHGQELRLQLNPQHHNALRILDLTVGSKAEQCVLLCHLSLRRSGLNQIDSVGDWEEWLWYDAVTVPGIDEIIPRVQRWLNHAIEELGDEVLT